jgi:hypothetical protein
MNYLDIIFPHVNTKIQKKEIPYILCYNIRMVDYRNIDDQEFKNYFKGILNLIKSNMDNNLVGSENNGNLKQKMRQAFNRAGNGNSAEIELKFITAKEKKEMDNYLIMSGWSRRLDKYSFIYEGCRNDDKLFLGGRNEMLLHYCKLFPFNSNCVALKKKFELAQVENKMGRLFTNPDTTDKLVDNLVKFFEKDE